MDKVSGKGLSTVDYTYSDYNKVSRAITIPTSRPAQKIPSYTTAGVQQDLAVGDGLEIENATLKSSVSITYNESTNTLEITG